MHAELMLPFLRVALGWLALLVVLPLAIVPGGGERSTSERLFHNVAIFVTASICLGYAISLVGGFELPVFTLGLLICWWTANRHRLPDGGDLMAKALEVADNGFRKPRLPKTPGLRGIEPTTIILLLFGAAILAVTAWIRLSVQLSHFAPPLSDSYVTMSWAKHVENSMVFGDMQQDGLYPRGFHIILALIRKLSARPMIYAIKFVGPLNGVMMAGSVYAALRILRVNRMGALLGAGLFGMYGIWGGEPIRQAATNSQEFGTIFILPAAAFAYRHASTGFRGNLRGAVASTAAAGLIHPIPAVLAGMGAVMGTLAGLMACTPGNRREGSRRAGQITVGLTGAAILAAVPLAIGYLMGYRFHESSADFLTSTGEFGNPLPPGAVYGIAAAGLSLFAAPIIHRRWSGRALFVALLVSAGTGLSMLPALGVHNAVIATRGGILLALAAPMAIGYLFGLLTDAVGHRKPGTPAIMTAMILLALPAMQYGLDPFDPDEYYETEGSAKAIMKAFRQLPPGTWYLVSPGEGFSWVNGTALHMHSAALHHRFPPKWPLRASLPPVPENTDHPFLAYGSGKGFFDKDTALDYTLLVVIERKPFQYPRDIEGAGISKERATADRWLVNGWLVQWLNEYREWRNSQSFWMMDRIPEPVVFFSDDDVTVYRLGEVATR